MTTAIDDIQDRFAKATKIQGRACQLSRFAGNKFVVDDLTGNVVLEVHWLGFDDQKFYAAAHDDVGRLLAKVKRLGQCIDELKERLV